MTTIHYLAKLPKKPYKMLLTALKRRSILEPNAHSHSRINITHVGAAFTTVSTRGTGTGRPAMHSGRNSLQALHNQSLTAWHPSQQPVRRLSTSTRLASSELVYQGPLTTMVKGVKFFSLSTSVMGAAVIPILLTSGNSGVVATVSVAFGTLMLATPIVLHWLSRSYITKLYFDREQDSYTANTVTFTLREVSHTFKATEVVVPPIRNVFTSFLANERPFLVDPRGFTDTHHLSILLGQGPSLTQEEIDQIMKKMKDDED